MIKYLGSKRTLIPDLLEVAKAFPELTSVADLFSGTSRVGHAFKREGYQVTSNDLNAYAHCLAECYVAADLEDVGEEALSLIRELNAVKGEPGYFTQTFCEEARFFQPHNGERIDAIREEIEKKGLPPLLRSVVLTSLLEAADRVDSTCGIQMAFVKQWAPRSFKDLEMRMPEVLPRSRYGSCQALRLDANEAVRLVSSDITYLDPPYNQHSYLSNYHIWESLVLWDKPETYGVARKRIDCRERKSTYNSKPKFRETFANLVASVTSPLLIVSFNNEGYLGRPDMENLLSAVGRVFVLTKDFKRYVGAQIGRHNPEGESVGEISHLRNQEYIYLVALPSLVDRFPDALSRLDNLAQQIGESSEPSEPTSRTALLLQALTQTEGSSFAELQQATNLSAYQTRMGLNSLLDQGLVQKTGQRKVVYSLCKGQGS